MKRLRLLHVKEEVRVLALAARVVEGGFMGVGVVYRGNKRLEGCSSAVGPLLDVALLRLFQGSTCLGQSRVVLLDDDLLPSPVDAGSLAEGLGRPVLYFTRGRPFDASSMVLHGGRAVWVVGLDEASAFRLLDFLHRGGEVEALRVAGLVLEGLRGCTMFNNGS